MNFLRLVIPLNNNDIIFKSFLREIVPYDVKQFKNTLEYNKYIDSRFVEIVTQAMEHLEQDEFNYLIDLLSKPNLKYFSDIESLKFENVAFNFGNKFREFAVYLYLEINQQKLKFNITNVNEYLLESVGYNTVVLILVIKDN